MYIIVVTTYYTALYCLLSELYGTVYLTTCVSRISTKILKMTLVFHLRWLIAPNKGKTLIQVGDWESNVSPHIEAFLKSTLLDIENITVLC